MIGSSTIVLTGVTGELWLGFNDEYGSNNIDDNTGSVNVDITTTPEPATFIVW